LVLSNTRNEHQLPQTTDMQRTLPVVAGILEDADGRVLIAQRAPGGSEADQWEFAGGKLRPGERAADALRRELREELGIRIVTSEALATVRWREGARPLNLHGHLVRHWQGEPRAHEHQALAWVRPAELIHYPMPAPDRPLRARLALPERYLIAPEPDPHDLDGFLATFARSIDDPGIGLASLRAKALPAAALRELATRCLSMAKTQRPELLLLLHGAVELARELGFDGAHLSATQLATLSARPLPESMWVFASCHSAEELALAQNLGADAATLSPVHPTTSHPRARALGWQRFARLARRSWLPCYALGGVTREDLTLARTAGAHGIAAIRGFWSG